MKNTLVIISGPTASGKTDLAIRWARAWRCPVLSADSRQVFKSVDIGTAKPPAGLLQEIPHFFINHVELNQSYSVGQFAAEAETMIRDLFQLHDRIILCGGTGLYIKAVLSGLDELPASTPEIKLEMQQRFQELGLEGIQNLLKQSDPEYYQQVDVSNSRRILRALEVIAMTGKPYSALRGNTQKNHEWDVREVTFFPEREVLYERINQRVDRMMDAGLLEEARALIAFRHMQALDTVGYKELFDFIDGRIGLDEAIERIKQHSRNYAKRQLTWFNKESRGIRVVSGDEKEIEEFLIG